MLDPNREDPGDQIASARLNIRAADQADHDLDSRASKTRTTAKAMT